jgi:hypothetical protein
LKNENLLSCVGAKLQTNEQFVYEILPR